MASHSTAMLATAPIALLHGRMTMILADGEEKSMRIGRGEGRECCPSPHARAAFVLHMPK